MVYFISGLGADERVFKFLDLSGVKHRFIKWCNPHNGEPLAGYCLRLSEQITDRENVVLIGLSFGGVVAQEIAKLMDVKKLIIISSVKAEQEFSWSLKFVRKTQIHRLVPLWLMQLSNRLTANYYFGVQSTDESILLQQIIVDTDPKFLTWAINELMNWKSDRPPENLVHIHGTADRIFPIRHIKGAVEIPNGGHFMIVNKVAIIQDLIFAAIN